MDFNEALEAIQKGRWVRRVDWPEGQYAFRSYAVPSDYYTRFGWKPGLSQEGSEEFSALRIKFTDKTIGSFPDSLKPVRRKISVWEKIRDPDMNTPVTEPEWEVVPLYGLHLVSQGSGYEVKREGEIISSGGGYFFRTTMKRAFIPLLEAETLCVEVNREVAKQAVVLKRTKQKIEPSLLSDLEPSPLSEIELSRRFSITLSMVLVVLGAMVLVGVEIKLYFDRLEEKAECVRRGGVVRGAWCMPKSAEPLFKFTRE